MQVLVLGAGVSGWSCAIRLAERGHGVEVWAPERGLAIVSSVAGALWYPLRSDYEPDHSPRRLADSYETFVRLVDEPAAGVVLRDGVEIFRTKEPEPGWWSGTPAFSRGSFGGAIAAFEWRALPVIDMPVYLAWLEARASTLGVSLVARAAASFDDALRARDVVVNCTGLGARDLAGDAGVFPVRGQVVRVEPCGVDRFILDEQNPGGPTYIIPRANDVVLGGTREPDEWSREVRAETARAIVERCVALDPRLRDARIVSQAVGLRPGRARVRLETEERPEGRIVHNYGHSGSGVTLSWGCASAVVGMVEGTATSTTRG